MIRTVIFDLDDTLAAEDNFIRSGYTYIGDVLEKKYNLASKKVIGDELYQLYLKDSKNVFNRFLDENGIEYTKDEILELVNGYRNHIPDTWYYDDVLPLVTSLKQDGINIGIISDGYLQGQKNKADVLKTDEYFDKVIFTDELGREYWKPSPKAFELMKEYFQTEYEEMIYVGDNPEKDFYIRETIPIHTVRIIRPGSVYEKREYREGIEPEYCINSLLQLKEILR